MSTSVLSGVRAVFSVNGKKVAWAAGVTISEEIMYEPVEVLDNIETQEHVPIGYRVTMSCEIFRTISGTPGSNPPAGSVGSLKELGLFPRIDGPRGQKILLFPAMTATIHDRLTNKQLSRVEEVKPASYNFNYTARGVTGQGVTFTCIRHFDESGG